MLRFSEILRAETLLSAKATGAELGSGHSIKLAISMLRTS